MESNWYGVLMKVKSVEPGSPGRLSHHRSWDFVRRGPNEVVSDRVMAEQRSDVGMLQAKFQSSSIYYAE